MVEGPIDEFFEVDKAKVRRSWRRYLDDTAAITGVFADYEITRASYEATRQRLTQAQFLDRIVEAGRRPVERDSLYNLVGADAPSEAA